MPTFTKLSPVMPLLAVTLILVLSSHSTLAKRRTCSISSVQYQRIIFTLCSGRKKRSADQPLTNAIRGELFIPGLNYKHKSKHAYIKHCKANSFLNISLRLIYNIAG